MHSCNADKNSIKNLGVKGPIGKYASWYTVSNQVTNGGFGIESDFNFVSRCQMAQADCAFLFFAFAVFAGSIALDFFGGRSSSAPSTGGGGFKFPKVGRKGGATGFV